MTGPLVVALAAACAGLREPAHAIAATAAAAVAIKPRRRAVEVDVALGDADSGSCLAIVSLLQVVSPVRLFCASYGLEVAAVSLEVNDFVVLFAIPLQHRRGR